MKADMKIKKGFALIFTLMIASLIIAIIVSITAISSGDLSLAKRMTNTMRAYYLAEAGLARKFAELRADTAGHASDINNAVVNFPTGNSGSFSVDVEQVGAGVFPTFTLTSTGTYPVTNGVSKTLRLTVRQITIARYIYLTNLETRSGSNIWFIGGDIVRGPMHTNGQINIYDDPVFEGPVSSVSDSINYYHGPPPLDNPDFQSTLTLGAPRIQLPVSTDIIASIKTAAQQTGGSYFIGNTTVTLMSNGTANITNDGRYLTGVTNAGQYWVNHNIPLPANGALFVNNGNVDMSGILAGQLTVATNSNIYIVNNILYNNDPRTDPNSTDMLGLVSQNNVIVDSAAPYNLEIDAYILALNTSFYLENYTYGLKGTLTLYGGITQVERGAVGTFNINTGLRLSGYKKDYNYDERFKDVAPAYFPPAKDVNGRIMYLKIFWQEL
jgi:Tfp pilus assembly protein PilE